jgi:hypothetical protein
MELPTVVVDGRPWTAAELLPATPATVEIGERGKTRGKRGELIPLLTLGKDNAGSEINGSGRTRKKLAWANNGTPIGDSGHNSGRGEGQNGEGGEGS